MTKKLPIAYIASPYTKGDPAINTRFQMEIFNLLMNTGEVWPYAPLVSHFQHTIFPQDYKKWIEYDLALLERFDVCVRLPAVFNDNGINYYQWESSGAEGEVKRFRELGKPAFEYPGRNVGDSLELFLCEVSILKFGV